MIPSSRSASRDCYKGIDFLFNNAGVVVGKPFHTQNSNDIARTMRINAEGMMYVTNAFLPAMIQAKSGHIINITSALYLLKCPNPKNFVLWYYQNIDNHMNHNHNKMKNQYH